MLSSSLLFYFSCTSPWLLYVPAVWNNVYFVAPPEYFVCVFSFLGSRSSFTLCSSLSFSFLVDVYPFLCTLFFLLRSPVIWVIVFTAVNFHLVLFFFQFFIWSLPCLLWLGAALRLWFGGWSCHPGSFLHYSWPLPSLWPLPFDFCGPILCTPPPPCVACALWSPSHVALVLWWRFLLSPGTPPHTTFSLHTPNHRNPHDDPPPYCPPPPYRQPGPVPLALRHGYSSSPSLRAAKVAKAAAAVANSSSSPVKELRDLSAMDAFRSRSISVSEHAVRRLEKSLLGNQTKNNNNNNPNTCCFLHGMVGWV